VTYLSHTELDKETISKAYARWAPVYDLVFGAVFERGREAAVAAAERVGGRILEVGIGTGMSLADYSRSSRPRGETPDTRRDLMACPRRRQSSAVRGAPAPNCHIGFIEST